MKKLNSKYMCRNCGGNTQLFEQPVRSTIYKALFCDLKCYQFYENKMRESKNELYASV